jgi:hypothetical protein
MRYVELQNIRGTEVEEVQILLGLAIGIWKVAIV